MLQYIARLTQHSEDDPTASPNPVSNTVGEIQWTRTGTGKIFGQFPPGLIVGDAVVDNPVRDDSGDVTTGSAVVFTATANKSGVAIASYGTPEDGSLQPRDIEGTIMVRITVFELT